MNIFRSRLFDYIHVKVKDIAVSKTFYKSVVEALGYSLVEVDETSFWIDELYVTQDETPSQSIHMAFHADHPAAVKLFHEEALRYGGSSDGSPEKINGGGGSMYSARVLDPDGNVIEAVYHRPMRAIPPTDIGQQSFL